MILSGSDYRKLLKSKEYADHLICKTGDDRIHINFDKLPKDHYLPVSKDYCLGIKLVWKINEAIALGYNSLPVEEQSK